MTSNEYPGIGRLAYTGSTLLMWMGGFLLGFTHQQQWMTDPASGSLILLSIPLAIAVTALRLINIGETGWLALGILIPFAGLIMMLICVIVPPGYREHKQMDTVGGAMVAAAAALVTVIIALIIFG